LHLRCTCGPTWDRWRKANSAALASAVGRHACLAAAQSRHRQSTRTQCGTGTPSHCSPHPQQQSWSPCCELHKASAKCAGSHWHSGVPPHAAALRQGRSRCTLDAWQEENSRGE
jgi:hypothetical protein